MGKSVACIIARTGSSRLPDKVIQKVNADHTMVGFIIERLKTCTKVDEIYVCTTREESDNRLEEVAREHGVNCYRGSTDGVIERFISVGKLTEADTMIRITGDNVFTSVEYLETQISFQEKEGLDYVRMIDSPLGATAEIMSFKSLMDCYNRIDPSVSEYLLMFMFDPDRYKCGVIKPFAEDYSGISITVDTSADMERTRSILQHYNGKDLDIELKDIVRIIEENNIPNSHYSFDQMVKMPNGRSITYGEFKKDMHNREQKSKRLELNQEI